MVMAEVLDSTLFAPSASLPALTVVVPVLPTDPPSVQVLLPDLDRLRKVKGSPPVISPLLVP